MQFWLWSFDILGIKWILSLYFHNVWVTEKITKHSSNTPQYLDLRKSIFPFLNRELFDLRKIYVVNLKTGRPKKKPYAGEFATWDLS